MPRRTPRDPDRRRWAFLLTQLVLEFTVLHELSHIVAGHLLFKRARLGLRSPTRARPVRPRPSGSLETQRLLELDADAYALNLFTTNLLSRRVSATPIPADGSDQELYLMTSLALDAYFALTSPEAFGMDYTPSSHHRANRVRRGLDDCTGGFPREARMGCHLICGHAEMSTSFARISIHVLEYPLTLSRPLPAIAVQPFHRSGREIRSPITRGLQPCRRWGRPPRRSSAYGCLRRLLSAAPAFPRSPGDAQGRGRGLLVQQPSHWPGELFVMVVLVRVTGLVAKMPPP